MPLDLETICLKCLEKDPTRRYSSALSLVEDLRSFLEGRAIRARKISGFARAWRVCRRNAAVSILVATICVTLFVAVVVLWRSNQDTLAALRKSQLDEVRFRRRSGRLYGPVVRGHRSIAVNVALHKIQPVGHQYA